MEEWIERMIFEHAELEIKCLKLKRALVTTSPSMFNKGDNMAELMSEQYVAMRKYKGILEQRIELIRKR